jgi:endo-1,4-beta-mannosidase
MRRSGMPLTVGGECVRWLGANFWSATGGPLMWRTYDPAVIERELRVLREHGMTMTRSFCYWPDFMPEPDRIDDTMAERFADFLDRHADAGMTTVPTFLVGHMSGENWDPAWRGGRDLYGDVWLVARQAWFASELVRRFGDHPAVAGWLVSNEMPIYGDRADRATVTAWAQLIRDAVRAAGGRQPFSLGDGAWGLEITGVDNGFSVRDIAALVDFLGPHVYKMEDDQVRQHYAAAWICELAGTFGRPVVLEEFGVSSEFVSDANAAHYYRQVLHNSLLAGATGWIGWNNTDYDHLAHQDPYRHHAFEMHFGLTDWQGGPKPALAEFRAFADVLAAVDVDHCRRADADTVLVVPSYLDTKYPFTEDEDRTFVHTTLRQAYVSARLADLPVVLSRESDGLVENGRLYLVPSTKQLLAPTWARLERLASDGATVYVSYSPGAHSVQRGPWYANLNALFGVRHRLRYGLVDPVADDEVTFTFTRPFGTFAEGARLTFRAAGTPNSRTYLPVDPVDAEVVAVDAHERPALLVRRVGAGSLVFGTYGLEHMAAVTPAVNPEAGQALYGALATYAGIDRIATVDDPRIAADVLCHEDGRRFLWLVSQADVETTVKPTVAAGLRTLTGEPVTESVVLGPFAVGVYELVSE